MLFYFIIELVVIEGKVKFVMIKYGCMVMDNWWRCIVLGKMYCWMKYWYSWGIWFCYYLKRGWFSVGFFLGERVRDDVI